MKKATILSILLSVSFAVYNVGQTVSTSDQNVTLQGCSSISDYYNEEFKLADWNGATNNGDYKVIWLEMSASW